MAKQQPTVADWNGTWDFSRLKGVATSIDSGFEQLGRFITWALTDGKVAWCCNMRAAAMLREAKFRAVSDSSRAAALLQSDFSLCLPHQTLGSLLTWQRMANVSISQVLHTEYGPIVQPWNLALLSRDTENKTWQVRTTSEDTWYSEYDAITLGKDWLLLGTEVQEQPWWNLGVGWQVLAPLCIGGVLALVWWMRNAMHTSIAPVIVGTGGIRSPDRDKFFEQLAELGQTVYLEKPHEFDMERLRSEPTDFRSSQELALELDRRKVEFMMGQSATQRIEHGSYGAVQSLIQEISAPLLALELENLAYSLNAQWLPLWREFRRIPASVSISLGWDYTSLQDLERIAEVFNKLSQPAASPELSPAVRQLLQRYGYVTINSNAGVPFPA